MHAHSVFDLGRSEAYEAWRAIKLAGYPVDTRDLIVPIRDPYCLSSLEKATLLGRLRRYNMVIYELADPSLSSKSMVRALGRQFGLQDLDKNLCADEDSVSSLRVRSQGRQRGYIPYTSHRLNWHTDGYYNDLDQRIRSFILHCAVPAAKGGANALMDPEVAYILLRDTDPDYIKALCEPDAMTIPPNIEQGDEIRPEQTGPVFSIDPLNGNLLMRYTARTRNVVWKDEAVTQAARTRLTDVLKEDSPYVVHHRLQAGQGVLSNNVLHSRGAFADEHETGQVRLLYRARYYNRIQGTDLGEFA